MTTRGKNLGPATWRMELKQLIADMKERFVSDSELARRVWQAWREWVIEHDHLVSERHFYEIEQSWKTRPNLNSTAAEIEWVAGRSNSRTGRFWESALLRKVLAAFREQRRAMDWSTARDLNMIAHYFGR